MENKQNKKLNEEQIKELCKKPIYKGYTSRKLFKTVYGKWEEVKKES